MIENSPYAELEQLLSEDVFTAKQREQSTFDILTAPFKRSLVIFGAGNLGRKIVHALQRAGIEPLAYADNNCALWGTKLDGLPVLSPADAATQFGKSAAFIVAIWPGKGTDTMAERCQTLRDLGCEKLVNFGVVIWKYPEVILPRSSFDLPHKVLEQADDVRRAFALFEDDASQKEFVAQVRWRLWLDFDGLPRPVTHEQYFPEDLVALSERESFVDCGAFDGDTMESFLRSRGDSFGQYAAFEADPTNFRKLENNVSKLSEAKREKIVIYPLAVGARRETVCFDAAGTETSAVGSGSLEIDCAPLDEILSESSPSWIKMDIEGSEFDALIGARKIISTNTPVMAICVYHQQNHLWRIPLLIREMSADYRFFLRPHWLESWELVCYAIPSARLRASR